MNFQILSVLTVKIKMQELYFLINAYPIRERTYNFENPFYSNVFWEENEGISIGEYYIYYEDEIQNTTELAIDSFYRIDGLFIVSSNQFTLFDIPFINTSYIYKEYFVAIGIKNNEWKDQLRLYIDSPIKIHVFTNAIVLILNDSIIPYYYLHELYSFGALVDKDLVIGALIISNISEENINKIKKEPQNYCMAPN